jgi:integrase
MTTRTRTRGHGEGSIFHRKDGLWVAAVNNGRNEHGRRQRRVFYGRTRHEVQEKLKPALRAQQQGLPLVSDRLTVRDYLTTWIEGAKATVRDSTWYRYNSLVRRHLLPHLGHRALSTLQPADCSVAFAAMAKTGLKPRTIIQARAVLGRALREAEVAGLVTRNAARLARPPRVEHAEMLTLTRIEARTLIEAAQSERLGTIYALALASGAREGELLALRWADVDWDRGAIRIRRTLQRTSGELAFTETKTASSRRTIPLGASTMDALRRHQRVVQAEERLANGLPKATDDDLVFATELGTPIDAGNFLRRTHYPLLDRAGLPRVRFHDLRHTAATLLLEAGVHVKVVAERLGHATPSLVMNTYGHVTDRMQKDATTAMEVALGS